MKKTSLILLIAVAMFLTVNLFAIPVPKPFNQEVLDFGSYYPGTYDQPFADPELVDYPEEGTIKFRYYIDPEFYLDSEEHAGEDLTLNVGMDAYGAFSVRFNLGDLRAYWGNPSWQSGDVVTIEIEQPSTGRMVTVQRTLTSGGSPDMYYGINSVTLTQPPVDTVTIPIDPADPEFTYDFGPTNSILSFSIVYTGGNITVSFFNNGPVNPTFGAGRSAPAVFSNYYWDIDSGAVDFEDGWIHLDVNELGGVQMGALTPGVQPLDHDPEGVPGGLVIYKRANSTSDFLPLTTWYDVEMAGMLSAEVDEFSEFAIGTNNEIHTLPVELSSFTANVTANMFVELQWIAETETNMLGYHVYRGDSNAISESSQITGQPIPATNSSEPHSYTYVDEDVLSGNTYYYWLQTIDLDLTHSFHGPVAVTLEDDPEVPDPVFTTALNQNFPNPFNPETTIKYSLREDAEMMELKIYNVLGQLVKTIHAGPQTQGEHTVVWDGRDNSNRNVTSGIYFYRMSTPTYNKIYKMMLLK
jgi:hypothetical protein